MFKERRLPALWWEFALMTMSRLTVSSRSVREGAPKNGVAMNYGSALICFFNSSSPPGAKGRICR